MLGIQVFGFVFGIVMIYISYKAMNKKEISEAEFSLWLFIWLGVILSAIFHKVLLDIAETLGLVRATDLVFICGFIFLLLIVFYNYLENRKLKKKVYDLVSRLAKNGYGSYEKVKKKKNN